MDNQIVAYRTLISSHISLISDLYGGLNSHRLCYFGVFIKSSIFLLSSFVSLK
jgi:hypothetical protein